MDARLAPGSPALTAGGKHNILLLGPLSYVEALLKVKYASVNYAFRFSGPVTALRAKTRAKSKIDCPEVAQLPSPVMDQ